LHSAPSIDRCKIILLQPDAYGGPNARRLRAPTFIRGHPLTSLLLSS
jgi:hypothetical protein